MEEDNFDWPNDLVGEDGQLDMEAFMEMLESDPQLMAQFQG